MKSKIIMGIGVRVKLVHQLFINQGGVSVERDQREDACKSKRVKLIEGRLINTVAFNLN